MTDKRAQIQNKIKIKQFEWYQVETKVRELLTQLLQPFLKKQTQQSIKINELKRGLNLATQKIEDHDFLLSKQDAQKPAYIQIQDDRIEQLSNKIQQQNLNHENKLSEMKKIIDIYEDKIKQLNNLETKLEIQSKQRIQSQQTHKDYIANQFELMLKKLDNQDDQIKNFKGTTRNTVSKLQTKSVVLDNRINDLQSQMKRRMSQIRKINEDLSKMHEKTQSHQVRVSDLTVRISNRQKDQKLSQKFFGRALQLSNDITFLRNYLMFYQPLYNQMQISQTLHHILKDSMKIRLCLYEQKAYAQIHNKILTTQADTLEERMSQFTNRIRKIINKNKKYIIKLKVLQTIKYGTNVYEIRQIDEQILKKNESKIIEPAPVIVPENQIKSIIDSKWETLANGLQSFVKSKVQPLHVWITQLQEQSLMRSADSDQKTRQVNKDLQKLTTQYNLHQSEFRTISKKMQSRIGYLQFTTNKYKQSLRDITNFNSVLNHIIIQDQIDRQKLALYALKPSKTNQQFHIPGNIKLDQKCASCSDPNSLSIVTQAFKMACLAYNPSQIRIDKKIFSREQVFQISTGILERLKKRFAQYNEPQQTQMRSKSVLQKSNELSRGQTSKNESYRTIDSLSRKKQPMFALPTLGNTARKRFSDRNTMSVIH